MKIGLIYPSKFGGDKSLPLGIGYIASFLLEKNPAYNISILDTGIQSEEDHKQFWGNQYDIIGISITSRAFNECIEIINQIKTRDKNAIIVIGGPHVSIMRELVLQETAADFAIYGEGEQTFSELVALIEKGKPEGVSETKKLANINGLIFRYQNKIKVNPPRKFVENIDSFPFPAFHLFPMERYPGKYPMITSRGCPFSCVYCASSSIWERKWRPRSPENIIAEMKYIHSNYKPRPIDFHDDGFNMSLERVNKICDLISKEKIYIPWGVRGFRADIIDRQTAEKMHKAGCSHVAIGIESADNALLKRMGKRENIETIDKGINLLRGAGIDVIGQFMIGNPGETLETVSKSIEFALNSKLNKAVFGPAVPFPRTDLWKYVQDEGTFLEGTDCSQYEEIPANSRIIFETKEFSKDQRMQALKMAQDAGFMPHLSRTTSKKTRLKTIISSIWFQHIHPNLPPAISFHLYFLVRRLKAFVST